MEEKLISIAIQEEHCDAENNFSSLVKEISLNTTLLEKLENTLLQEMLTPTENIIHNAEFVSCLENIKKKISDVGIGKDKRIA